MDELGFFLPEAEPGPESFKLSPNWGEAPHDFPTPDFLDFPRYPDDNQGGAADLHTVEGVREDLAMIPPASSFTIELFRTSLHTLVRLD